MRIPAAILAMAASSVGLPTMAHNGGDQFSYPRSLLNEQFALPEAVEKLRTARYGLRAPNDDYFEPAVDEIRFRWKLNRVKMRIPFSTWGLR